MKLEKYVFAWQLYCESQRHPGELVPCGGAFCATGARTIIKAQSDEGFKVVAATITMHDASQPFDWNNPISTREIKFK
ncbi:MAG: hypothetical protein IKX61_01380 [Prevotella sp.]|nr:hypothetical protein [Prevotella sp.]